MHTPRHAAPVLILFSEGDVAAVANDAEFRSLATIEHHRQPFPAPVTLARLRDWYPAWLLLPPPGPEGDAIAAHWRNLPESRAEKLVLPEGYDTLAALVRAGANPVAWIRGELEWLGVPSPTALFASQGR